MNRFIPPAPHGSEQWQNGWETGFEQALLDQERAERRGHDGPRTWQIEYPPAPPAGTRVRTTLGAVFTVDEDGRIMIGQTSYSWKGALEHHGPLTEVVQTEVEAAARRLRENRDWDSTTDLELSERNDIRTVLAHVLNGGTLPEVK